MNSTYKIFVLILSLILLSVCWLSVKSIAISGYRVIQTDILVVGGSQSGIASAIQAARMGSKVILVTKNDSLGGSMIEAGVSAIDGNELQAFQTGIWGEFLYRLSLVEKDLLKYGWVSLFTFNPSTGGKVIENWLKEERNIKIIKNLKPKKVIFSEEDSKFKQVKAIQFSNNLTVSAKITIDATELGDLLQIGNIPYRLGWEYHEEFQEPSAPKRKTSLINRYPVQELTWVFFLEDYRDKSAPIIPKPEGYSYQKAAQRYWCAFKNKKLIARSGPLNNWKAKYSKLEKMGHHFFSEESFLTYGQVSPKLFMVNWPVCGNDYSKDINKLFQTEDRLKIKQEDFSRKAHFYSLWFAKYLQETFGQRFGLSKVVFPATKQNLKVPGFAFIPYFREARRLIGLGTLTEAEILPDFSRGEKISVLKDSVAIGNYPNDHHYFEIAKKNSKKYYKPNSRSIKWGGRNSGAPFSIPFRALIPVNVDGLLVAEKSWSVSHVANGSTRLQPACIQVGQAVGAMAALSVQKKIQPFHLKVPDLQATLVNDPVAPPTLVPVFDLMPDNKYRAAVQRLILSGIIDSPKSGMFYPKKLISKEEFFRWSRRAKVKIFLAENFPKNLRKDEAAYLIESKALTLSKIPVKKSIKQSLPIFDSKLYCGKIKRTNNNFSVEQLKNQNRPVYRKTPLAKEKNQRKKVNKAGIITINPDVYKFLLKLSPRQNKYTCFEGVLNNSAGWITVLDIPEYSRELTTKITE